MGLWPHNHDFGRFHQRVGLDATLETEFPARLTGDDCGYDLTTHIQFDFGEQSVMVNAFDGSQ